MSGEAPVYSSRTGITYSRVKIAGAGSYGCVFESFVHSVPSFPSARGYALKSNESAPYFPNESRNSYHPSSLKVGDKVAIKMIESNSVHSPQASMEIHILSLLMKMQENYNKTHTDTAITDSSNSFVTLFDYFVDETSGKLCLVFEWLPITLLHVLNSTQLFGLPLKIIKPLLVMLLSSVHSLHATGLVHCDLKPENAMINASIEEVMQVIGKHSERTSNGSSSSMHETHRQLLQFHLKLIDFGSAIYEESCDSRPYTQSRFYRAPEVILGLPHGSPVDLWSIGCIAAELFLGLPLFPGCNERDQLERISRILGGHPSDSMISAGSESHKFFQPSQHLSHSSPPPPPPPGLQSNLHPHWSPSFDEWNSNSNTSNMPHSHNSINHPPTTTLSQSNAYFPMHQRNRAISMKTLSGYSRGTAMISEFPSSSGGGVGGHTINSSSNSSNPRIGGTSTNGNVYMDAVEAAKRRANAIRSGVPPNPPPSAMVTNGDLKAFSGTSLHSSVSSSRFLLRSVDEFAEYTRTKPAHGKQYYPYTRLASLVCCHSIQHGGLTQLLSSNPSAEPNLSDLEIQEETKYQLTLSENALQYLPLDEQLDRRLFVDLLARLISWEPLDRITIADALNHPFLLSTSKEMLGDDRLVQMLEEDEKIKARKLALFPKYSPNRNSFENQYLRPTAHGVPHLQAPNRPSVMFPSVHSRQHASMSFSGSIPVSYSSQGVPQRKQMYKRRQASKDNVLARDQGSPPNLGQDVTLMPVFGKPMTGGSGYFTPNQLLHGAASSGSGYRSRNSSFHSHRSGSNYPPSPSPLSSPNRFFVPEDIPSSELDQSFMNTLPVPLSKQSTYAISLRHSFNRTSSIESSSWVSIGGPTSSRQSFAAAPSPSIE
jgi:serine/threonine protein kinase